MVNIRQDRTWRRVFSFSRIRPSSRWSEVLFSSLTRRTSSGLTVGFSQPRSWASSSVMF